MIHASEMRSREERRAVLAALGARRPRSRFLRAAGVGSLAFAAWAWWSGGFDARDFFSPRRVENLGRFLQEIRPHPLQGQDWDGGVAWRWAWERFTAGASGPAFELPSGLEAVGITLAISVVAIALAGLGGGLASFFASRSYAHAAPFSATSTGVSGWARWRWRGLRLLVRAALTFLRAVPEYVWAYLGIGLFGVSAWPAVVALALHNTGILGRLDAEVLENLPRGPSAALRVAGASRGQIALFAGLPAAMSRFLLYFFYRWETCVRESTVLGLLGVVSLGYALNEARVRDRYDDMLFYVVLGGLLVLAGDLVSLVGRAWVRRAA